MVSALVLMVRRRFILAPFSCRRGRLSALADQRAIEVGTLKTEIKRLQRVIESSTGP
jgi:hypothetical protein